MSNRIATWLVAVAALGAAACASDASDADLSPQNTDDALGNLGKLDFGPCPENESLECGTLSVPIDYHKPWGEKVDLAVVRARDRSPKAHRPAGDQPRGPRRLRA